MSKLKSAVKHLLNAYSYRTAEYKFSKKFVESGHLVLDAGCGTGTFMRLISHSKVVGLDINSANVKFCKDKGLDVKQGSVLEMPYEDDRFDVTHCSHVMQVFAPEDAAQMVRELARVTKPGGLIIITTLNWFKRFYKHPENIRPYPPDTFWRYFAGQDYAASPMFPDMPNCEIKRIWLRRKPLLNFDSSTSKLMAQIFSVLATIQYNFYIINPFSFSAYTIVLRKQSV